MNAVNTDSTDFAFGLNKEFTPAHLYRNSEMKPPTQIPTKQMKVIQHVLDCRNCLYSRLGITKYADSAAIRRAYLTRSKLCHPDRNKDNPLAKEAFQQLSTAYKTLSCPSSRRAYDVYGVHVDANEHTFSDAVAQVFTEFLDGQYDSLIHVLDYLQAISPDIKINKDVARQVFSTVREYCLWGGKCWDSAKFEIIKLYELQQDLCSLSYFNVFGRLKLSVAISKCFLLLPFCFLDPGNEQLGIFRRTVSKMILILERSESALQRLETVSIM